MTYPRDPIGIRWDDHYTMANQVFYAFHSNRAPSSRVQPEEPVQGGVKRPKRGYASKYVGVIKMKNKFYAVWGEGKDGHSGPYPLDADGELIAAWARARALGRDWLEGREIRTKACTMTPQEPFCADTLPEIPESTENEASVDVSHGHAPKSATPRRKLGGKRVA